MKEDNKGSQAQKKEGERGFADDFDPKGHLTEIYKIMKKNTALVIGASMKEDRYSNKAIRKLRDYGKVVSAIGLREGKVEDVDITTEKKPFKDIDTVTLYLNPKRQPDYYDYIVSLKPRRVIFNPGTENDEFYSILKENGIEIEVACTLVLLSTDQY